MFESERRGCRSRRLEPKGRGAHHRWRLRGALGHASSRALPRLLVIALGGFMQIALALYPKFTMLDIVGPFQVLADVPGHEVSFVAAEKGLVVDHTGRGGLVATQTFADLSAPDVVVVPGGLGDTE